MTLCSVCASIVETPHTSKNGSICCSAACTQEVEDEFVPTSRRRIHGEPHLCTYPNDRLNFKRETATDFYYSLSHAETDPSTGLSISHPITDQSGIEDFLPRNSSEEKLLDYARRAWFTACLYESSLVDAIYAWRLNDLDGCLEALEEARGIELEYGNDNGTQWLAEKLVEYKE